jgi:transcriptional regulator with XRE-family HTH domain
MTIRDACARNIRSRREALALTQFGLAERAGVTQTAVSYWEAGKRQPSLDDLELLASALGTTAAALITEPSCLACADSPPPGFICAVCGRAMPS